MEKEIKFKATVREHKTTLGTTYKIVDKRMKPFKNKKVIAKIREAIEGE